MDATIKDVVETAQDRAVTVMDWVERVAEAFTPVDLALLAVAILVLVWVISNLYATVNLGPVEIVALEHDAKDEVKLLALTATLRERLDKVGLPPPPAVPSGAPQADVIQAVEVAPVPQSAFVAKLLELLPAPPRPLQFRVSGTLLGVEPPSPGWTRRCGISFWLQPLGPGTPALKTIHDCPTHDEALRRASGLIYREIAKAAPEVFPLWARWDNDDALTRYSSGCEHRDEARHANARPSEEAMRDLAVAASLSPSNALAPLEIGNLEELLGGVVENRLATARLQASALDRYLTVGEQWPLIVEARFRASVLASVLAGSYAGLSPKGRRHVEDALRLRTPATADFEEMLRRLSRRESRATRQLARRWFTLLRDQRLRNPFEWRGPQRSALTHTVRISRHCVAVRRLADAPELSLTSPIPDMVFYLPMVWAGQIQLFIQSAMVHGWHLVGGKGNVSWQACYNAASFDALRLAGGWTTGKRRIEQRAIRNLQRAVRESDGALPYRWVANDPDLAYFRDWPGATAAAAEQWEAIVAELEVHGPPSPPSKPGAPSDQKLALKQANRWLSTRPAAGMSTSNPRRLPDRAWGDWRRRIVWSSGTATTIIAIALAIHISVGHIPTVLCWIGGTAFFLAFVSLVFAGIDAIGGVWDHAS
jgi:hypothetical protein